MPTYEYRCKACGHTFELLQMITEDPEKVCPACGGEVERLISAGAGLMFKGSGFYITDHRSDSYKKAANADKPSVAVKSDSPKSKDSKPVST